MNTAFIEYITQLSLSYGLAFVLSSVRILGFMQFFPVFTWAQLPQSLRSVMSFVLATPMAFALAEQMPFYQGTPYDLLLIGVKEFAVGGMIGLLCAMPFIAAQAAGDTIDLYRGASASNIFDPVNSAETTLSGTMFLLFSLVTFIGLGGLAIVLDIVYRSYQVWPVLTLAPKTGADSFLTLAGGFVVLLKLALLIAAPMIILLATADLFLVFASKGYKQLQIFELSNTFKNLLFMLFMPMYMLFFWKNVEKDIFNAFIKISEILKGFFI